MTIDAAFVRRAWRRDAARRGNPNAWPELILAMARGDFAALGRGALASRAIRLPDPVHFSMDCSSGISDGRRRRYEQDPARSMLGDINFEHAALCDVWPAEDLDASFHDNVVSDIPTLIVHGTWDMSTPLENAREVARTLTRSRLVEVIGGNHGALYNLYERWAPMRDRMREFLTGHDGEFPAAIDDMKEIVFKTPREVSDASQRFAEARTFDELMAMLRPEERATLVLHYRHELTHVEIADTLSLPVGTVKTLIRRARLKLKAAHETTMRDATHE